MRFERMNFSLSINVVVSFIATLASVLFFLKTRTRSSWHPKRADTIHMIQSGVDLAMVPYTLRTLHYPLSNMLMGVLLPLLRPLDGCDLESAAI